MLIYKTDEEVIDLVKAFEQRTLLKADWIHGAHLSVGLYYCVKYPFGMARNLMRDGIYWLNDAHCTPNTETSGYHETLTCFWMTTIKEFLRKRDSGESLAVLANDLVATYQDAKLPLQFYSRELLFSTEARMNYVAPDLMPEAKFGELFYEHLTAKVPV